LQGLISGDPTTGLSMLTQSFSFTYQLSAYSAEEKRTFRMKRIARSEATLTDL
jgi:hypothetical protein